MAKKKKNIVSSYPVIPLRGTVVFPGTVTPILVGRKSSIDALEYVSEHDSKIFFVAQKNPKIETPSGDDLFTVGTIAHIVQVMRFPSKMLKVLIEGEERAKVVKYDTMRNFMQAVVLQGYTEDKYTSRVEALFRKTKELFRQYVNLSENLPDELARLLDFNDDYREIADIISAQMRIDFKQKQKLLEAKTLHKQFELLLKILIREVNILRYKEDIEQKVQNLIEENQREYFLRQQMDLIRSELGEENPLEAEMNELRRRIKMANIPKNVREAAEKEFLKLSRMQPSSPEAAVSRTYIDWLLELPWYKESKSNIDIETAEKILDKDHYGLEKIKQRIIEHIAVMNLSNRSRGPILCFVGPPGVGKTSIARSVARATGREFVRASLGGLHDEAEIRGHRRTYVGALPGKIIQGIKRAGKKNPIFLLDEIDKIGTDFRGDPAAALMEVLDPDQNNSFMDNYIELPFDLSKVLFITTANTIQGIPIPLLDRMEILRLPGYLENEKLIIAKDYLFPKELELIPPLKKLNIVFTDEAFLRIIREYTREAGVRELERQIASILRKIAVQISKNKRRKKFTITPKKVEEYLGVPKYTDSPVPEELMPGEALGLAWTSIGGQLLHIEVLLTQGKGEAKFTGSLGDVMKESIHTAMSLARSRASRIGISPMDIDNYNVHIHFPEGAVPKDGPSAGAAITCAILSALSKRPLPSDIAITGEITLSGRILPIGGLTEKLYAAKRFGLKRTVIPKGNEKELAEIKKDVLKGIKIIPLTNIDELLDIVFLNR
ncbi:endopeptidase La [bacterium]|nr:MAG: endopeptidase La [bacterium]